MLLLIGDLLQSEPLPFTNVTIVTVQNKKHTYLSYNTKGTVSKPQLVVMAGSRTSTVVSRSGYTAVP